MPGGPLLDPAGVHEQRALVEPPAERREVERRQGRLRDTQDRRPGLVHGAEVAEVAGVGAEAGLERGDERVLVGRCEQGIGAALVADGGQTPVGGGGGAEAAGPVGGVHRRLVGQREQLVVQRAPQGPGEPVGLIGGDEVGAGDGAHQQRPAREHADGSVAVGEQVGEVLGGVPGRGQGPQAQAGEVDGATVRHGPVRPRELGARRSDHGRAEVGELAAAGHEVGVEVGLDAEGHPGAAPLGLGEVAAGMAARVDDRKPAVAEVDDPRRVA